MGITRERFAQGLTYQAWKTQMTRNRERFEDNERGAPLTEQDLAAFRSLPRPLHVMVLAEEWCGDVIANLPILGRIAEDTGKFDLRVFLRDQNVDLMDQYLNKGEYRSIPVFAFFDDDFRQVGVFIERPGTVTELRERKRREVYASDRALASPIDTADKLPEAVRGRLQDASAATRAETSSFADREVIRQLGERVTRLP